jgi:N-acetylornithine carbamoyltransferase
MRHYYRLTDLASDEILELLDRAEHHRHHPRSDTLARKEFVLIFLNPSLRTRASFEVAIRHMGGGVTTLGSDAIWPLEAQSGAVMDQQQTEHVFEATQVLSRYYDGIGVRSLSRGVNRDEDLQDQVLASFMERAQVPVFNMESSMYHPCQALGDLLTIRDLLGEFKGRKITVSWAYHPKPLPLSVPNSILLAACKTGMDVTLAHPPEFGLPAGIMNMARAEIERSGGTLRVSHDHREALKDTEIIYAKAWGGLHRYEDPPREAADRERYQSWRIDREAMHATRRAFFMHCLPVRRNVVVTDEVLESAASKVIHQAENRLHVQKAILEWLYAWNAR